MSMIGNYCIDHSFCEGEIQINLIKMIKRGSRGKANENKGIQFSQCRVEISRFREIFISESPVALIQDFIVSNVFIWFSYSPTPKPVPGQIIFGINVLLVT